MEKELLQERFNQMCATGKLFRSTVTGSQLWDAYLKGFGEDPIFRDPQSSVHNCNQCKHFFNRYGNIVAVDGDNRIMTMFDTAPDEYKESFRMMSELLKNAPIQEVFVETYQYLYNAIYEQDLARWANRAWLFKSCDFLDFSPRKGFKCSEYFK